MRIVACLVWFDETVESLERCVSSLAGVVDVVVACDGRWDMFPGRRRYSPAEQAAAIASAGAAAGLVCDVYKAPRSALTSQVAKRNHAMRRAAGLGDWILVIDGDEWVESCDPGKLRDLLAAVMDVGEVSVRKTGAEVFQKRPLRRRRLYRAAARLKVVRAHNGHLAADGRWLNGDPDHVELAPAVDASPAVALVHDRDARAPERQKLAGLYYRARAALRVEAWAA